MANDKRFVVKSGLTTQNIAFVDNITNATNTINLSMIGGDILSFSAGSGQLFSLTDSMSGTIFSVNDISGIPSIEVDDDGTIRLAEFDGNILLGTATDNGTDLLQVDGSVSASAITVDDVVIDGKVITMTGSSSDTAVFTAGTNGTLSIVTTDATAAAANIQITADGTVDIDSAGVLTLDSGAAINIEPAAGSAILLDGTISIDAGVVTGATSITSTAFVGAVTGNADTATTLATARTIGGVSFNGSANIDLPYTSTDNFMWRNVGALTSTSTANLLTELLGDDVFDSNMSAFKTSWSYAGNGDLTDAGRLTELAGTSWLTWTDNSADNTQGNITALVIAPNTGGSANKMFVYNNQGSVYSPGWREIWTSTSDGSGSGLDADLLDGLDLHTGRNNEANKVVRTQANGYVDFGWINTTSGVTTSTIDKIYASNDSYMRYVTPATLISQLGLLTTGNNITIGDAGTIGSASDTDAIAIAADGVVTMNQIPVFSAGINVSGGSIAGTLSTAAQTNITSLGTLTALTVDDISLDGKVLTITGDTDDTFTITSTTHGATTLRTIDTAQALGVLALDADGRIHLDAGDAYGQVTWMNNGTNYASFHNSGTALYISHQIIDGDIYIRGRDSSGNFFNALTFDMSAAGKAAFNAGATFANNVELPDNVRLTLGATADVHNLLELFHDGTNSILRANTAPLWIQTDDTIKITKDSGTEAMAYFIGDGAVELYHDASKKFETTATGATVTGAIVADSATVDDINLNGKVLTITGDTSDTFTITSGANGATTLATTDAAGTDGNLTLDADGLIILDAGDAYGQTIHRRSGSNFGTLFNSGDHFYIKSLISDGDLIFSGNDGGSTITALTIDMSEAGLATFNDDVIVGDDLLLKSDGSRLFFGAGNDVLLTHIHDSGLRLTHGGSGDNLPVVFQLKSEEDAIIADEVIASLEFAAGDSDGTDGATVAAGIHAIAEGTFSASANATKLVFTTGVSETAASSATAKMTLSSAGNLTVAGTVTADPTAILLIKNSSGSTLKTINGIAAN